MVKGLACRCWSGICDSSTSMRPCRGQSDSVLYPATCDHLHLPGTSDAAGGYNQIRLVESLQEEVDWILSTQLWPADGYDGMMFVTTEGYDGLEPPPLPFKVLTPSLLAYTCAGFIHYLLFPFHFISVSFTAFSPTSFSSGAFFAFLFCRGLDSACFVFLMSQIQYLQVQFGPSFSP